MKSKSKFNSLDRISKRKTESRKGNRKPPSLVVVDTEETSVKQNSNVLTLSRKDKKKKQVSEKVFHFYLILKKYRDLVVEHFDF